MEKEIQKRLDQLEKHHGIEILFAVEGGSRAWGFDSQDSDYDVRFVYKRPLSWYMSIKDRRDVIESSDKVIDIVGWDIQKTLYQIYKGNPAFMEWLNSPVEYRDNEQIMLRLEKLSNPYWNPRKGIYHYLHMASGNYRTYLKEDMVPLKKYLYVLRPLFSCLYIQATMQSPPIAWDTLTRLAPIPKNILDWANEIVEQKRASSEMGLVARRDYLNDWIEEMLDKFAEVARVTPKTKMLPDDLNEFFYNEIIKDMR